MQNVVVLASAAKPRTVPPRVPPVVINIDTDANVAEMTITLGRMAVAIENLRTMALEAEAARRAYTASVSRLEIAVAKIERDVNVLRVVASDTIAAVKRTIAKMAARSITK